jgi:hypothetical protein
MTSHLELARSDPIENIEEAPELTGRPPAVEAFGDCLRKSRRRLVSPLRPFNTELLPSEER